MMLKGNMRSSVMNKQSILAMSTCSWDVQAAILKRNRRLKILVHLCQNWFICHFWQIHARLNQNGSMCFSVTSTQRGRCKQSSRLKAGLAHLRILVWKNPNYNKLLNRHNYQFLIYYYFCFFCNLLLVMTLQQTLQLHWVYQQLPPVSSWIQWMTHPSSSVVL